MSSSTKTVIQSKMYRIRMIDKCSGESRIHSTSAKGIRLAMDSATSADPDGRPQGYTRTSYESDSAEV